MGATLPWGLSQSVFGIAARRGSWVVLYKLVFYVQKCRYSGEGEKLLHSIVCPQVFKKRGQEQLFSFLAKNVRRNLEFQGSWQSTRKSWAVRNLIASLVQWLRLKATLPVATLLSQVLSKMQPSKGSAAKQHHDYSLVFGHFKKSFTTQYSPSFCELASLQADSQDFFWIWRRAHLA